MDKALSQENPIAYSASHRIIRRVFSAALMFGIFSLVLLLLLNSWPNQEWKHVWQVAGSVAIVAGLIEIARGLRLSHRNICGRYGQKPTELGWIMEDMFKQRGLRTDSPFGRVIVAGAADIAIEEFKKGIIKLK